MSWLLPSTRAGTDKHNVLHDTRSEVYKNTAAPSGSSTSPLASVRLIPNKPTHGKTHLHALRATLPLATLA